MRSIEEKADTINTILSPKRFHYAVVKSIHLIQEHLHDASVIKHTPALHKLIKKIILSHTSPSLNKTFSIACPKQGEGSEAFVKSLGNAQKCHSNLSFRLAYLERLLFEDKINLRAYKQLKAVLIKNQLACLGDFAKNDRNKPSPIKAQALSPLKNALQNHINPYTR